MVVIDTGPSRRYGEAMREAIARVTPKPVIQVLLTHHHPDHALGNQAFKDVPIGALAGTTRLLHEQGDGMAENLYRMVGDWMRGTEVVLPTQVLEPGVLSVGGHDLRLLALTGHTGADLADPRPEHRRAVRRRPGCSTNAHSPPPTARGWRCGWPTSAPCKPCPGP